MNVRVPTSHPVPQAKPGSIHPPWAWEASPTTVSMPATAPKGALTSRKVRDPESVNHPPPRSACAHILRKMFQTKPLTHRHSAPYRRDSRYTGRRGTIDEADETTAGLRKARTRATRRHPRRVPFRVGRPQNRLDSLDSPKVIRRCESFSPTAPTQAPALDRTGSQTPERGAPSRGDIERRDRLGG